MIRPISIEPVLNGFVCIVGCQRVVFASRQTMVDAVNAYYERPEETEKRFVEQAVNKTLDPGPCPTPPADQCRREPMNCVTQAGREQPQMMAGGMEARRPQG